MFQKAVKKRRIDRVKKSYVRKVASYWRKPLAIFRRNSAFGSYAASMLPIPYKRYTMQGGHLRLPALGKGSDYGHIRDNRECIHPLVARSTRRNSGGDNQAFPVN